MHRLIPKKLNRRGDTIIEVMVSMTVLGLVLGISFVTTRHSLQSGLQASYRDQAQSYAQQQLELIKSVDDQGQLDTRGYKDAAATRGFCINPDLTKTNISTAPNNTDCTFPTSADVATRYTVKVCYSMGCSGVSQDNKTFYVRVEWASSTSDTPNSVTLYYKPHNSAIVCTTSDGCYNPPTTGLSTPPPADWMCFHTDRVATCGPDNQNVSQGSSIQLQWTSIPTTGTTCNTSGSPTPWFGDPSGGEFSGSGTHRFDPPTFGTYSFRLNCTNFLGSTLTKTIVITTPAPTPIVAAGTGAPIHGSLPPFSDDSSRWILQGTINPNNGLAISGYYFRIGTANPPTTNFNCSAYGPVSSAGSGSNAGTCSQTVPFSGGSAVNIQEMVDISNAPEANKTRIYYQLCAVTSAAPTCSSIVNFVPHLGAP